MPDQRRWLIAAMASAMLCLLAFDKPPSRSPRTSTGEGLQLLHKMQAALGGAGKIAAIYDYEETVRAQSWNPDGTPLSEVRKRTRWMRSPNLIRLDQIGARDTYVLYFDGSTGTGWEILPDLNNSDALKTVGKSTELSGGELKFAQSYLAGFQFRLWLADRMPGYVVTSPAPNVVRIEHESDGTDFTLEAGTGLPLKTSGVSLANPNRPVQSEMRYEAWIEVAGVRFPSKRANYHGGLKLGEITGAAIHVNTGLKPQDLARKPADFFPDVPR